MKVGCSPASTRLAGDCVEGLIDYLLEGPVFPFGTPRSASEHKRIMSVHSLRLPFRRSSHCFAASSMTSQAGRSSSRPACLTALITLGLIIVRNCRRSPTGLRPRFGAFFSTILISVLPKNAGKRSHAVKAAASAIGKNRHAYPRIRCQKVPAAGNFFGGRRVRVLP
jgi:hypothetical protein